MNCMLALALFVGAILAIRMMMDRNVPKGVIGLPAPVAQMPDRNPFIAAGYLPPATDLQTYAFSGGR